MIKTRRKFLMSIAGCGGLLLLPACGSGDAPLNIGLQVWPGYEPMMLAKSLGWLEAPQFNFTETGSASESLDLLAAGKLDCAGLTLDEVLRGRERSIELSVILVCDISAGADVFLARPDIKRLSDIKGRRVGVEAAATSALMLANVLQTAGLKPDEIVQVPITTDQHVDAWKAGQIDAVATYEPAASHILDLGGKKLFDSRAIPNLIVDVLAVRSDILTQTHQNSLRRLVAMHFKALSYLLMNPGDASHRMASRFKVLPEDVMPLFRGLVLPDRDANWRLLGTDSPSLRNSIVNLESVMTKTKLLKAPVDIRGILVADYLPTV